MRASGLPVEFLGWREDMASVFAQLDLVVIPSKHEALSLVLLEAFSAGAPVIAFTAGGMIEVIKDEDTVYLVQEASADALRTRISELMRSDPACLQRVACNARQRWEESYNVTLYQQHMVDWMERVAHETVPPR